MRRILTVLITMAMLISLTSLALAVEPEGKRPDFSYDRSQGLEKRMYPDGYVDYSHGPDPYLKNKETAEAESQPCIRAIITEIWCDPDEEDDDTEPTPATPEKPPTCATGYRFRVIYAYETSAAAGSTDEIRTAVARMNAMIDNEAREQGSTASYRFACNSTGDVGIWRRQIASCDDYGSVVGALRNLGFTQNDEKYLVFCGHGNAAYAGQGSIANDDTNSVNNDNNNGPSYAVVFDNDNTGFDSQWLTAMHEVGHTIGAVQHSAPDASGAWHCDGWLDTDVMCYNDGGSKWDETHACGTVSRRHFDACHNDYFDPTPSGYLASHWNIGSCHLHGRWFQFGHC